MIIARRAPCVPLLMRHVTRQAAFLFVNSHQYRFYCSSNALPPLPSGSPLAPNARAVRARERLRANKDKFRERRRRLLIEYEPASSTNSPINSKASSLDLRERDDARVLLVEEKMRLSTYKIGVAVKGDSSMAQLLRNQENGVLEELFWLCGSPHSTQSRYKAIKLLQVIPLSLLMQLFPISVAAAIRNVDLTAAVLQHVHSSCDVIWSSLFPQPNFRELVAEICNAVRDQLATHCQSLANDASDDVLAVLRANDFRLQLVALAKLLDDVRQPSDKESNWMDIERILESFVTVGGDSRSILSAIDRQNEQRRLFVKTQVLRLVQQRDTDNMRSLLSETKV